jgi:integrase
MGLPYKTYSPVDVKTAIFSVPAAFQPFQFQQGQKRYIPMKHLTFRPAILKTPSNGKWFIEFYIRHPITNEFERFKVYGLGWKIGGGLNRIQDLEERLKAGTEWAASWTLALEQGWMPPEWSQPEVEQVKDWTFAQAMNLFKISMEAKSSRKKTWQSYWAGLHHFNSFPKYSKPLSKITRADVENFLLKVKVEKDLENTTYNNYLRYTKAFFNYCVNMGYLDESPVARSAWLKEEVKSHRFFTDEQWTRIKKHATDELLEFIEFLYNTGTRPTDARLAKWKQVYADKFHVMAETTKTDKDRFVPLSLSYAAKLNEKRADPNDYIFGGKQPKGINHFGYQFTKLRRLLQMDDGFTLYGVKHTRCVHLALQGASPYDIMNFVGHTSLETTMKYLRNLGVLINRNVVDKYKGF